MEFYLFRLELVRTVLVLKSHKTSKFKYDCIPIRAIHLARPTTIYCGYRFLIDWYVIGLERTACSSNL